MRVQANPSVSDRVPEGAGFTVLELLVVLTIGGILTALAVPAFSSLLEAQRPGGLVSTFLASLGQARSEAIKRNARAVMCKSADGVSCAASGGWEQGWILFHDRNNNAAYDLGEQLIRQDGPVAGVRLSGNTPVANYVSYSASGSAKLTSGAFQAGTFTLCPLVANGQPTHLIVLSGTGRPRYQKGNASACP